MQFATPGTQQEPSPSSIGAIWCYTMKILGVVVTLIIYLQVTQSNSTLKRDVSDEQHRQLHRYDLLAHHLTTADHDDTTADYTTARPRVTLPSQRKPPPKLLPPPRRQRPSLLLRRREMTSEERMDRTNRAFDRMIRLVSLIGQVDSYIGDQARLAVRKLNAMYNEEDRYRLGY